MFSILMFMLGACFGSYLCCQVRRLHRKSRGGKSLGHRSVCLSCKTKLKWYDNIPIISWLLLKGKCRKCSKKIGKLEILSELGLAVAFLLLSFSIDIYAAHPVAWAIFIMAIFLTLVLGFLAIYDGAYGQLPSSCLTISIICAIIILALKEWLWFSNSAFSFRFVLWPLLSVLILGGLYLILYLVSKGKWVGNGDWLLGVAIGLALADPWLALLALFVANLLACLIMLPVVRRTKNSQIYFGPFLVAAFVLVYSFSDYLLGLLA